MSRIQKVLWMVFGSIIMIECMIGCAGVICG